jgi:hypothetical protein
MMIRRKNNNAGQYHGEQGGEDVAPLHLLAADYGKFLQSIT